jgi:hypothetical protein
VTSINVLRVVVQKQFVTRFHTSKLLSKAKNWKALFGMIIDLYLSHFHAGVELICLHLQFYGMHSRYFTSYSLYSVLQRENSHLAV